MKNIEKLLLELKEKGVSIRLVNRELKISAPKGALNPGLLEEIKNCKEEIIRLLSSSALAENRIIRKNEKREYFPLSFAQQRMWFLNQLEGEKAIYHISFALKVEGQLDIKRLQFAINEIVKRHETLRTVFHEVDGKPVQKILDELEFPFEYKDMSGNGRPVDEDECQKILKEKIIIPFDLTKGPVFRVNIFKISEDARLLLIVIHGIAVDGWSAGVLFEELQALYEYEEGSPFPLKNLETKFTDFCLWQREQYESGALNKQMAYWKKQLEGIPPILDFPFDNVRKNAHDFTGKKISFRIGREKTAKINSLIAGRQVSSFMFLWGVYALLLYKYTGQKDIVIGIPVANRTDKELEKLIGFFANTLVMRVKIDPDITFNEYLQEIKKISLEALDNQDLPFDQLVEAIEPERTLAHAPVFQTMFVLQNTPRGVTKETGLKFSAYEIETNVAHFDFTFVVNEYEEEISGFFEFNTALMEVKSAGRFINHYIKTLDEVSQKPDVKLCDIELITESEKELIFNKWNLKLNEVSENKTISEILKEAFVLNRDKEAVVFNGKPVTYKELDEKISVAAERLRKHGVRSEDIVGALLPRSVEMIVEVLAIIRCGAAYLPVDPEYPVERIRTILNESKVKFLISNGEIINKISHSAARNLNIINQAELIMTGVREVITDLDSLPLPDRGSVDYSKYGKYIGTGPVTNDISILSSRGCPYNCIYCHKIWPKKQFMRSSENIFNEVKKYYDCGIRRFTFLDDIFNLKKEISGSFFEKAIAKLPESQFFFPNGLRADILTEEFIDLMVEAGTVDVALALESGSPRIQKLIRKNLNLDKFMTNIQYFAAKYPHVLLELQTMFGFPTETEEEAMMTLETIEKVKWIDFPNLHVLKVFPNSEIYRLAKQNGISEEAIRVSSNLPYHALPETLPYSKNFARQFQARYMNEYFFNKERLLAVLPTQFKIFTVSEMVQKYDSYLPYSISSFDDILKFTGVSRSELGDISFVPDDKYNVSNINEKLRKYFPVAKPDKEALKILLLDVSNLFTSKHETMLHHQIEEPIGLMYLLANLKEQFGGKVNGKIAKSLVDFDSFEEMKKIIADFKPRIIGFRTLSIYKDFFHECIEAAKQAFPEANIIAGGPYATSEYDTMLSDTNIDFAVIGEGESTVAEFAGKYISNGCRLPDEASLKEIKGIAFVSSETKRKIKEKGIDRTVINYEQPDTGEDKPAVSGYEEGSLAYVLYTSGSTGAPKGVAMGRRGAANLINWHLNDKLLSIPMRTLQFASIAFDVSFQEIFTTLACGGALYIVDDETHRDPYQLLEFIEKNKIERLFLPVAALNQIAVAARDEKLYPQSVKQVITAGEQLKITSLIRELFLNLNDCALINHYGPTETHVVTSYRLIGRPDTWPDFPPIGRPVENANVFLLDEELKPVAPGLRGEIYAAGSSLAEGYLNNPKLTEERFIKSRLTGKRLYKTGDSGRYDIEGNIIFLGRNDDQIKVRGYRIEPGEIEAVINRISGVQNSAVVLNANNSQGNSLTAFIEYEKNISGKIPDAGIIKTYIESNLPDYMVPSRITIIDSLPVNSSGKINRKLLSQNSAPESKKARNENTNEIEDILLVLWKEILGLKELNIDDDFFRVGGHSLLATHVVSKVRKLFGIEAQLKSLFENPTVRKFTNYINMKIKNGGFVNELAVRQKNPDEPVPLSFNQRFFTENDLKMPGLNCGNISGAFRIKGEFYPDKFMELLEAIIKRHESLRMSVYKADGNFYQKFGQMKNAVELRDISYIDENQKGQIIEKAKKEICLIPFNLEKETSSRFLLLKVSDGVFLLLYAFHHSAFDGWSLGLFIQELNDLYAQKEPQTAALSYQELSYSDFAFAQKKWIGTNEFFEGLNYWKQNLYDYKPEIINARMESGNTETKKINIEPLLAEKLQDICRKKGITMFMLLFAAFAETLQKAKCAYDIVINTYSAGREFPELENTIGCFVNVLPLRIKGFEDCNPEEKLEKTREVCLEAYKRQSVPYKLIADELGLEKISDFMFVLQNNAIDDVNISGAEFSPEPIPHIDTPFELQCAIFTGIEYEAALTYRNNIYEAGYIEELLNDYKKTLLHYERLYSEQA